MHSSVNQGKAEVVTATSKRADGTIRQILCQDKDGTVHARGYFPPGTVEPTWDSLRYHWADGFTDEELTQYFQEQGTVEELRAQAVLANQLQEFVDYVESNPPQPRETVP